MTASFTAAAIMYLNQHDARFTLRIQTEMNRAEKSGKTTPQKGAVAFDEVVKFF